MGWFSKSAVSAMLPAGGGLKGVAETDLDGFLRRYRREAPALLRVGLVASALLYHVTPLVTVFVPLPAFLLPAGLREKHAQRFAAHPVYPIRMSAFTLKMVAGLCWGADPDVRRALGMRPLVADPGTFRESA